MPDLQQCERRDRSIVFFPRASLLKKGLNSLQPTSEPFGIYACCVPAQLQHMFLGNRSGTASCKCSQSMPVNNTEEQVLL